MPAAVAALRLIALTGLRREEACGLKWAEIDEGGHCLRLSATKTGKSVRPIGTPVLHLVRLRTADGDPMAIERTALSLHRYPGLDEIDFAEKSLYTELSTRYGVTLGMVSASIVAAPPEPGDAELLEIDNSTPCLIITVAPRTATDQVIEFGRSVYRSDRYDITVAYRAT